LDVERIGLAVLLTAVALRGKGKLHKEMPERGVRLVQGAL
jgi:hypothetical protein